MMNQIKTANLSEAKAGHKNSSRRTVKVRVSPAGTQSVDALDLLFTDEDKSTIYETVRAAVKR